MLFISKKDPNVKYEGRQVEKLKVSLTEESWNPKNKICKTGANPGTNEVQKKYKILTGRNTTALGTRQNRTERAQETQKKNTEDD